jgi:hypothetical protein
MLRNRVSRKQQNKRGKQRIFDHIFLPSIARTYLCLIYGSWDRKIGKSRRREVRAGETLLVSTGLWVSDEAAGQDMVKVR